MLVDSEDHLLHLEAHLRRKTRAVRTSASAAAILLAPAGAPRVAAPEYPEKPVEIALPLQVGSASDIAVPRVHAGWKDALPRDPWPDFRGDLPPRSAVLAMTKADGGEIGS